MNADHLRSFWNSLDDVRRAVDRQLDEWLPDADTPPARLHEAMRYSIFAGGKRFRPVLAILTCRAVGGADNDALPAACAVECIHTYSLIHDDLPAMDDDDFRRGRPSCHKAFDDATAILAGDALLTIAFEIIGTHITDGDTAAQVTRELAAAAGWSGMVGGQMADLEAEGREPEANALHFIHQRKTAALIRAAVRCGAISGGADADALAALTEYARNLGLVFQITDDVLDETATSEQLGKTAGKDRASRKLTFPAVYGLVQSRAQAVQVATNAKLALVPLGPAAEPLSELADFVVSRTS